MKKIFSTLLLAGVLATGAVACGSDDDDDNDTPTEETTAGTSGESGSDNPDVVAYCEQAEAFAAEAEDIDFSTPEASELLAESQELVARAAELTSVNASDAEAIAACNQIISDAMTP